MSPHDIETGFTETARQEPDALPGRRLVVIAVASVLVSAMAVGGSSLLLRVARPSGHGAPATLPSETSIELGSITDATKGRDLREAQRRALDRFRWLDRAHGVAEIPIDRAIDAIVEENRGAK